MTTILNLNKQEAKEILTSKQEFKVTSMGNDGMFEISTKDGSKSYWLNINSLISIAKELAFETDGYQDTVDFLTN